MEIYPRDLIIDKMFALKGLVRTTCFGFGGLMDSAAHVAAITKPLNWGAAQTAWTWLHKIRRAMVRPGRDRLCGVVEVEKSLKCLNIRGAENHQYRKISPRQNESEICFNNG